MRAFRDNLTITFLLVMLLVANAESVYANSVGTVRYLEVIAAHPRMQKFDMAAHRFKDGASAQLPLEEYQKHGLILEKKMHELTRQADEDFANLQKSLTGSAAMKSAAEQKYWSEKEKGDPKVEAVRNEIAANIAAMEFGGQTVEITLLPEISQIVSDVNAAIANIAKARGCSMIFNETIPQAMVNEGENWVEESYSAYFRSGETAGEIQKLQHWIASVDRIIPKLGHQSNLLQPVISGAVDLTPDVIKLLSTPVRKGGASKK